MKNQVYVRPLQSDSHHGLEHAFSPEDVVTWGVYISGDSFPEPIHVEDRDTKDGALLLAGDLAAWGNAEVIDEGFIGEESWTCFSCGSVIFDTDSKEDDPRYDDQGNPHCLACWLPMIRGRSIQ